ncbi:MAG: thioesterase family protein [Bacteroidales bacterium]|nr:thioesterase family protein [Bacteroidales bacterium]
MKKEDYIYSIEIDVRDYELDSEGIVNNANYLHYLEWTRHEFCKTTGMSFDDMRRSGIIPVLNRVEIDYITSLVSGDRMTSCLNLTRKGPRFVFHQDIYNQRGEPVVKAVVSVVALENGRLSRGDVLAKAFEKYL